ncbi:MAG: type II secretion system protein [Calditrichaeota bacterium]|nr:type II secretion system protein [Calditrichota bacterium]
MNKKEYIAEIYKKERGFSLIELITVIVLIGIISGIAYGVILLNARTFKTLSDQISTRWDVRKALDILREDLQELEPKKIFALSKGKNAGKKLFFKNREGDNIRYLLSNKQLKRRFGSKKWDVLLNSVQEAPFEFLDGSMNPTTKKDEIAYIRVKLVVDNGNDKISMSDLFFLRNTATNDSGGVKKGKKDDDDDDDDHGKDKDDHDKKCEGGHGGKMHGSS